MKEVSVNLSLEIFGNSNSVLPFLVLNDSSDLNFVQFDEKNFREGVTLDSLTFKDLCEFHEIQDDLGHHFNSLIESKIIKGVDYKKIFSEFFKVRLMSEIDLTKFRKYNVDGTGTEEKIKVNRITPFMQKVVKKGQQINFQDMTRDQKESQTFATPIFKVEFENVLKGQMITDTIYVYLNTVHTIIALKQLPEEPGRCFVCVDILDPIRGITTSFQYGTF